MDSLAQSEPLTIQQEIDQARKDIRWSAAIGVVFVLVGLEMFFIIPELFSSAMETASLSAAQLAKTMTAIEQLKWIFGVTLVGIGSFVIVGALHARTILAEWVERQK